jgi:hypothetical protein
LGLREPHWHPNANELTYCLTGEALVTIFSNGSIGLTFEGAGASFIGSGQTTTLNCAGGGAHILGNNNTLTLTGACKWLDMVGSNNTVVAAFANGANIEFAGSNNAITWTSPDGKEPVVRHVGSGNTLTAGH